MNANKDFAKTLPKTMTDDNVTQIQPREQTNQLVSELLQERQQVWSLYCSVAGMEPFTPNKTIEELLQEFCQLLVDYISLGHFGIYQRILDGSERRRQIIEAAEKYYPGIADATEAVLAFNDKYEKLTPSLILNGLANDLSEVGEKLATRIELEDELIRRMVA